MKGRRWANGPRNPYARGDGPGALDGERVMVDKRKVAMANDPKQGEEWVMECTLRYESTERLGDGEVTRRLEWSGFGTSEVVEAMLELFRREVDGCNAR